MAIRTVAIKKKWKNLHWDIRKKTDKTKQNINKSYVELSET